MLKVAVYFLLVCTAAAAAAVEAERPSAAERKAPGSASLDMSVLKVALDSPLAASASRARGQIAELKHEQNGEEAARRIQGVLAGLQVDQARLESAKRQASRPQPPEFVTATAAKAQAKAQASLDVLQTEWRQADLDLKSDKITLEQAKQHRDDAWHNYLGSSAQAELRITSDPPDAKKEWSPNEIEHWETCVGAVTLIPRAVKVIRIRVTKDGYAPRLEENIRIGPDGVKLDLGVLQRLQSTPAVLPGGESGRPEKAGEKAGTVVPATNP